MGSEKILGQIIESSPDYITVRKRAEEELRESEAKYKTLFTGAVEGILVADLQTKQFRHVNPAACRMFGYTEEEFSRIGVADIHPKESLNYVLSEFEAQARGKKTLAQLPCLRKDGTLFYANINAISMVIDGHKCNVGFFTDITEYKRTEEELKFRNILLSTEQEASIDGILVVDDNGKILSFNRRFVDLWGIPPDVIATKSDDLALKSVMYKLANPQQFLEKVQYLYEHKQDTSRDEIALKDGRTFDRYSAPMLGSDSKYYGRVWYFRDITASKAAEKMIIATKEKVETANRRLGEIVGELSVTLRSIGDAVVVTDEEGLVVRMNPVAEQLTGWSQTEANGRPLAEIFNILNEYTRLPPENPVERVIREKIVVGLANHTVLISKDGTELPIADSCAPIMDNKGRFLGVVLVFRDLRKEREQERALRETEKIVTMGHLAAGAAHEFNNPLGIIIGFAQVALLELTNDKVDHNKLKKTLEIILRNSNRCKNIVANLLDYGNVSVSERTPLNVNEVIEESLVLVGNQSTLDTIQIVKEYAKEIPNVMANKTQLIQVFNNILHNAIEAMKGHGIFRITTREINDYIHVVFRDNGRGVKKENLSKVFEPFFTTREVGGLGLSVCAGIIKSYKGFITLESLGEGQGATVTIRLPIYNTSQGGQK